MNNQTGAQEARAAVARRSSTAGVTPSQFIGVTAVAGAVAAAASFGVEALALAPWAMFIGFAAWFTRTESTAQGVHAIVCVWLGLVLALVGRLLVETLAPAIGLAAPPAGVFVLGFLVVALRTTPVLNNTLAWFLGMIAFCAAGVGDVPTGMLRLAAATAIGGLAGFICQRLSRRFEAA